MLRTVLTLALLALSLARLPTALSLNSALAVSAALSCAHTQFCALPPSLLLPPAYHNVVVVGHFCIWKHNSVPSFVFGTPQQKEGRLRQLLALNNFRQNFKKTHSHTHTQSKIQKNKEKKANKIAQKS